MQFHHYASILSRCRNLSEGKQLHCFLAQHGHDQDRFLGNHIVQMYGKCGSPDEARLVFDRILHRNVFSWSLMVAAYAQNGHLQKASSMLDKMPEQSAVSCTVLITAYTQKGKLREATTIFDKMLHRNVVSWNALVSAYAQAGYMGETLSLFESMPEWDVVSWNIMISAYAETGYLQVAQGMFRQLPERDAVSWNAMITAYAGNGHPENARNTLDKMPQQNALSWNAIVSAAAFTGHVEDARRIFEDMPERTVVSWNAMISAYAQNADAEKALELFRSMDLNGIEADEITSASILAACNNIRDVKAVHAAMSHSDGFHSVLVGSALVAAYGKCKSTIDAKQAFDNMSTWDVVAWTTLISAYAQNGHSKDALKLFRIMDLHGLQPDEVAFVCVVDACADLADLRDGRIVHTCIVDCGFQSHLVVGTALVNMYGKCGSLDEARSVFDKMPEQNGVSWNTMITVYAQNGHSKTALGLIRTLNLEGFQPNDKTMTIVLSTCSHAGFLDEGRSQFISISWDYGLVPLVEHYVCMIDLLGRAGRPTEAEELMGCMPFVPNSIAWKTLMGASTIHRDKERGLRSAEHVLELDPQSYAPVHIAIQHFEPQSIGASASLRMDI